MDTRWVSLISGNPSTVASVPIHRQPQDTLGPGTASCEIGQSPRALGRREVLEAKLTARCKNNGDGERQG